MPQHNTCEFCQVPAQVVQVQGGRYITHVRTIAHVASVRNTRAPLIRSELPVALLETGPSHPLT